MQQSINIQQYQRQIILPGIGEAGQKKLQQARVLMVGAGGLGCPALQYLVAAGTGTIGIADGDLIDLSNLHRQILYSVDDTGKSKALTAAEKLKQLNASCNIITHNCFIDKTNAFEIIGQYDLVIDGSDNFSTRYLLNDLCILLKKPLVYGAVYRFEGQVAVFNYKQEDGSYSAQYRDIFPEPPSNIQNCAEAGVLGVLPGIIGTMQATEAIKIITGIGKPLVNRLLSYNALTYDSFILDIETTTEGSNAVPGSKEALLATDYNIDYCITNQVMEIEPGRFDDLLKEDYTVIDVREWNEMPGIDSFRHIKMPLSSFDAGIIEAEKIVLFCQTGKRSHQAAAKILEASSNKKVYSLKGGIISWLNHHPELK